MLIMIIELHIINHVETLNNHEVHSQDLKEVQDPIQCLGRPMTRSRANDFYTL